VTARALSEIAPLSREAELEQAETLRTLGQLASGLAHDLNQSLGLIAGYSELALGHLERAEIDRGELRRALALIHRAALGGGTTLARLLSFARREQEPAAEPIVLRQLLLEVAELTAVRWRDAAQADGRQIQVQVEAEPGAIVRGWRPSLQQALTNLVLNAVDALPEGGTIHLRARRQAEAVEVEVADTGTGMPPEVQARVFEPFFTTKGARGTGLGLAQIFRAVDRHGGSIAITSEPGRGTAVRLSFPAAEHSAPRAEAGSDTGAPTSQRLRVLVVDDQPALARLGATFLAQDGHAVATAHSAEEGLEQLERAPVDVVVSDLSLGAGLDGWAFAQRVKARWPATVFVLLTGWGAGIDPQAARAAGVDAVVAKPYRLATLRQALRSARRAAR
jgi:CheY-like chemotaxis protein